MKKQATNTPKETAALPTAIDLEEAVLGALLLEKSALMHVIEHLQVDTFFKPENQLIYRAILALHEADADIDILTVTHKLRSTGDIDNAGGPLYISKLTNKIASTAHIEAHAVILRQKYFNRSMIRIFGEGSEKAYQDDDPFDTLEFVERELAFINSPSSGSQSIGQLMKEVFQDIGDRQEGKVKHITTGFPSVDAVIRGWIKPNLVYIGAKSSMGKTAFAVSCIRRLAKMGIPQAVFSLEMSKKELVLRIACQETGIVFEDLAYGKLNDWQLKRLHEMAGVIERMPIYIDDTPGLSIFEFEAKCRRLKDKYGVEVVWLDYVQLMTVGQYSKKMLGNREQEVSFISKGLKKVAKKMDIPVIALAQLNADDKKRAHKKPIISDLRESASLEHDADIVGLLYRPERAGELQDENGNSTKGQAELIIAKHRNGRTDSIPLRYVDHLMLFEDPKESHQSSVDFHNPDRFHEQKPF